jgi:hypothetical protein
LEDETEWTEVVAAPNVNIEGGMGELHTKGLAFGARLFGCVLDATPAIGDFDLILGGVELDVNDVLNGLTVDGKNLIAGLEAEGGGEGVRLDVANQADMAGFRYLLRRQVELEKACRLGVGHFSSTM